MFPGSAVQSRLRAVQFRGEGNHGFPAPPRLTKYDTGWWFGIWLDYDFTLILGISSSQLTFTPSFFRGVGSTTNQYFPVIIHILLVFPTINHPCHPFIDGGRVQPPTRLLLTIIDHIITIYYILTIINSILTTMVGFNHQPVPWEFFLLRTRLANTWVSQLMQVQGMSEEPSLVLSWPGDMWMEPLWLWLT